MPKTPELRAEFNALMGDLLCLSHSDECPDKSGQRVALRAGMQVTVFGLDEDEAGACHEVVAAGTVEPSPEWLQCEGSRWALRIDANGVRRR